MSDATSERLTLVNLATAAQRIVDEASAPVEVGLRHDRQTYVLVPSYALDWLKQALDPLAVAERSFVSHDPVMCGGTPTLNGTRLHVEMLAERYWHLGHVYEREILDAYGIRRRDLLICCWYVATYGTRVWRRRWGQWAHDVAFGPGWRTDRYDEIDLPSHCRTAESELR